MSEVRPIRSDTKFDELLTALSGRSGRFVVDENGSCIGFITRSDVERVGSLSSPSLSAAMRTDVAEAEASQTLNEVYADAGRGLPIAVLDDSGKLIGRVDPNEVLEELGRVEALADTFDHEVFM
jgi:CBS-domain-containing membrane protein